MNYIDEIRSNERLRSEYSQKESNIKKIKITYSYVRQS